jgi:PAS domain S-box-containing protein
MITNNKNLKNEKKLLAKIITSLTTSISTSSGNKKNGLLLENILNSLPANIYCKDKSGKYLFCNDKQAYFLGYKTISEVLNKKDSDLIKDKTASKQCRKNDLLVMKKSHHILVEESLFIHGKRCSVISHKAPLLNSTGAITGIIGVSIDIGKLKEKEEQFSHEVKLLNDILNGRRKFLANVSHEVRTPMQGAGGILQGLREQWHELTDAEKFSLVKEASENTDRLIESASNLLNKSEISFGSLDRDFVNLHSEKNLCDLKILTQNIIKELSNLHNITRINLEVDVESTTKINADSTQMTEVIKNLIHNAVKYGAGKDIIVRIEDSHMADKDAFNHLISAIKFSVIDHGIGIPEDELGKIFEPFKKNKKTELNSTNNARLNLSMCKEIIDLHTGEIWGKNNEETSGVTISFTLPRTHADIGDTAPEKELPVKSIPATKQQLKNLNILFVDDEAPCITSSSLIFKSLGHNVTTASNGIEALEKLKTGYKDFDLIFLDIMMPKMNGLETVASIKKHPNYKDIPIFMQSGISDGQELNLSVELGAHKEFLQKPFNRSDMSDFLTIVANKYCKKKTFA